MLRLEVIRGVDVGTTLACSGRRPRMIGRASRRMRVGDHKCSRSHARVWVEDGRWWIQDLDSRHGTYVNKMRIDRATPLEPGDEVRMGNLVAVVREATLPPAPRPSARPSADAAPPPVPLDLPTDGPCLALRIEGRRDGQPTPLAGQVLQAHGRTWLGRKDAPLTLQDSRVSAQHARLDVTADGWLIADLGSSRGTFINGWRIDRPTPLKVGDHLWLGGLRLSVAAAIAPPAAPEPMQPTGLAGGLDVEPAEADAADDFASGLYDLPLDEPIAIVDEAAEREADVSEPPAEPAAEPAIAVDDAPRCDEPVVAAEAIGTADASDAPPPCAPTIALEPVAEAPEPPAPEASAAETPLPPAACALPEPAPCAEAEPTGEPTAVAVAEPDPTPAEELTAPLPVERPAAPRSLVGPGAGLSHDPVARNMAMIFPHFTPVRVDAQPSNAGRAPRRGPLRRLLPTAVVRILP